MRVVLGCYNDKPILSFGISVKNEERFRDTFYFLNYIEFEHYINEMLEQVNSEKDIVLMLNKKGET